MSEITIRDPEPEAEVEKEIEVKIPKGWFQKIKKGGLALMIIHIKYIMKHA